MKPFRFLPVVVLLISASCGNDNNAAPASTSPAVTTPETEVVLVTYSGYVLPEGPAKAFTAATGITIKVVALDDAGAALSRAIVSAGSPEGDVMFGVDSSLLTKATESGAFDPFEADGARGLAQTVRLDPTGQMTPIDEANVCINYDAAWFADKQITPPSTFDDLVDPTLKGLTVLLNPATSSPGLTFVAAVNTAKGADTSTYFDALRANDVSVVSSWSDGWDTRYTVNGGDRPIVLSYASSPPAEVVYSSTGATEPMSRVALGTCVRQVEFAAVLRGAAHPTAARRLIEEMLSPEWQAELPLSNFVFPVVSDVPLPEVFTRFAAVPDDPIVLDPAVVGRERDAWIDTWRNTFG